MSFCVIRNLEFYETLIGIFLKEAVNKGRFVTLTLKFITK